METETLGRSIVVAIDHGLYWGACEGLENPGNALDDVLEANPDGILESLPLIRRYRDRISSHDIDVIATLDMVYDSTYPSEQENAEIHTQVFDVANAAELADAAKVALVFGREDPDVLERNAEFVASAAKECRKAGIPLVVEPILWGARTKNEFDAKYLMHANRLALELGADILKSSYPGEGFERIVKNVPQPVYIAGGPAATTDRDVLEMVHEACDLGGQGVMFGRNIWQRDNPGVIVKALAAIVHENASIDEAAAHT